MKRKTKEINHLSAYQPFCYLFLGETNENENGNILLLFPYQEINHV